MTTWRILSRKAPPPASRLFHGLDTDNLYFRDATGHYVCIAGRPENIGKRYTKAYVESCSGIRNIPSGTHLELII